MINKSRMMNDTTTSDAIYKVNEEEAQLRLFLIQFLSNLTELPVPTVDGIEEIPLTEEEGERLEGLLEDLRNAEQWWQNCRVLLKELREYFVPHLVVYFMTYERWPDGTRNGSPAQRFGRDECHALLRRTFQGFPEQGDPYFVDEDKEGWLRYFVVMREKLLCEFNWLLRATFEIDEAIVFPSNNN